MPRARLLPAALIGLLVLSSLGFRPYLTTSDVAGYRLSHEQGQLLAQALAGPDLALEAAILYDVDAGQTLYAFNEHARLAPASTTKIATALVTLRHADLEQTIVVGPESAQVPEDSMRYGLTPGDTATVEQLLYALLLNSGADAAMALAAGVGGSVDQFILWMNELVASLGLLDTHFVNPHGMDAPDQYSSAYDLMVLACAALENPIFAGIVAQAEATVDGWSYTTTNELLGKYSGVDGVKTGTTDQAGQCLVASATREGHRVILVVLGSVDRYVDGRRLLDYYYGSYVWRALALPANAFSALPPAEEDQQSRYYVLAEPRTALVTRWEEPWLRYLLLPAPAADDVTARFLAGDRLLTEVSMIIRTP